MERLPRQFLKISNTTITTVIEMMRTATTAANIPPMMATLLLELGEGSLAGDWHSGSSTEEIATGHSESNVIRTPVTMTLDPLLTQSSITETSAVLLISEVPSSLARYVTCMGESEEQENDSESIMSLVMPQSLHESINVSSTVLVTSFNFSSVDVTYR